MVEFVLRFLHVPLWLPDGTSSSLLLGDIDTPLSWILYPGITPNPILSNLLPSCFFPSIKARSRSFITGNRAS